MTQATQHAVEATVVEPHGHPDVRADVCLGGYIKVFCTFVVFGIGDYVRQAALYRALAEGVREGYYLPLSLPEGVTVAVELSKDHQVLGELGEEGDFHAEHLPSCA